MLEILKTLVIAVRIAGFCVTLWGEILSLAREIVPLAEEERVARIAELDELDPDTLQGLA